MRASYAASAFSFPFLEQPKLLESLASKLWTPAKVLTSEGNKACQQLSYSDDALTGSHRGVLKDLLGSWR